MKHEVQLGDEILDSDSEESSLFRIYLNSNIDLNLSATERALTILMLDFDMLPELADARIETPLSTSIRSANPDLPQLHLNMLIVKDLGALGTFRKLQFNLGAVQCEQEEGTYAHAFCVLLGTHLRNWFKTFTLETYPECGDTQSH